MITNHPSEVPYYGIHTGSIQPVQVSTIYSPTGELFIYHGDSTLPDVTRCTVDVYGH